MNKIGKTIISRFLIFPFWVLLSVILLYVNCQAAPDLINFQGRLTGSSGAPVADGDYPMSFRVFDAETVGTLLWQEGQTVTVSGGIYNVLLGSGTTTVGSLNVGLFSADSRWLEVVVSGEIMTPRQRITSVAYSLQAGDANSVGGMLPADILPVGRALACFGDDKVTGLNGTTGDVICDDDTDTYNAAYDTEAEIDTAVANNNYSTGPHNVDTNAATICASGYFLNGDGSCDPADAAGDCSVGRVCSGGHTHTVYNSAASITSGVLHDDRYDSYGELTDAGRLDNNVSSDILLRSHGDARYARKDILQIGTLHIDAAAMTPDSNALNYGRINGGIITQPPSTSWYGTGNVDVPNGATFTNMRVFVYDNDASNSANFSCSLYRRYLLDIGAGLIANVSLSTSGANPNVISMGTYDMHSSYKVVSEQSGSYYVYASGTSMENSSLLAHMGCRIQFTYQELLD